MPGIRSRSVCISRIGSLAAAVLIVASTWLFPAGAHADRVSGPLKIYVFNVGQGDAILVVCPQGRHHLLIDAGARRESGSVAAFKAQLTGLLGPRRTIDVAIATHPHDDHVAGMPWVLDTFAVKRFVDSGRPYTPLFERIGRTVQAQVRAGRLAYFPASQDPAPRVADFCTASNVTARLLVPHGYGRARNPNNDSVVVVVDYDSQRFLFTGDAEEEEEALLLEDPTTAPHLRDVTVYKVGHHGSHTSSSPAFLAAVRPTLATISSGCRGGTNDGYRHPREITLLALNAVVGRPDGATSTVNAGLPGRADGRAADGWSAVRVRDGIFVTAHGGTILIEADGSSRPTVTRRPPLAGEREPCRP